jgi:FkbM family methyltransferase
MERIAARLSSLALHPSVRRQLKRVYLGALRCQTRGRGLTASLPGGETVHVLPEYRFLSWNPDEYRAFRAAVSPGMTALDIGANVGAYALLFGQWVGTKGAVFAFEPSATVFEGLRRHIELNGLDRIVTPVSSAVGAQSTRGRLIVGLTAGESRLANGGDVAERTVDVAVITVDHFCAMYRVTPDVMKVDVEGAELDVLRGARETIARLGDRLQLFVEFHPSMWRAAGISVDAARAALDALHLDVQPLVPGLDPWTTEGMCVRLVPKS